jgi:hypothetical protein
MAPESSPAQRTKASSTPTEEGSDYTRLHITPLDQDIVKVIIPAALLPSARNLSFHTIDTFPEKRYGFVDLPQMEADKLKRKLNGATLKGSKMRIEKARPEERVEPCGDAEAEAETEPRSKRAKSKDEAGGLKKRKRDHNAIEGVVLPHDRKVKRGWTESADTKRKNKKNKDKSTQDKSQEKRRRLKSKYTEQDECLLKTKLPPNTVGNLAPADAYKKKKKKGNTREITVHEFEKTTKFPSFLKLSVPETNGKPAIEFVQGKGWVDEDGNVVEVVKEKVVPAAAPKRKEAVQKKEIVQEEEDDEEDDTSSSGTSSEDDDSESAESEEEAVQDVDGGSDGTPSDDSSDQEEQEQSLLSARKDDARPASSSSSKSLTIKIPPATPSASEHEVHPLEALYKRAKPEADAAQTPAQESQPFSFFGGDPESNDDDVQEEPAASAMPMTPYSRQDFEWRNVRSAAPTPDTAHPSRMKNFWASQEGDADIDDAPEVEDEEDDEEEGAPAQGQAGSGDFQTWFWENRRDLNKSWMTRKKSAAKEKRHRENKARASKAV